MECPWYAIVHHHQPALKKRRLVWLAPHFSCHVPHRISRSSFAFMQWGWEPACIRHVGSVKKIQILFKVTCVKFAVQGRSPLGAVIFLNFYFFGVKKWPAALHGKFYYGKWCLRFWFIAGLYFHNKKMPCNWHFTELTLIPGNHFNAIGCINACQSYDIEQIETNTCIFVRLDNSFIT